MANIQPSLRRPVMEGIAQRFFWKRGAVLFVRLVASGRKVADHFVVLSVEGIDGTGLAAPHVDVIDFSGGIRTGHVGGKNNVP